MFILISGDVSHTFCPRHSSNWKLFASCRCLGLDDRGVLSRCGLSGVGEGGAGCFCLCDGRPLCRSICAAYLLVNSQVYYRQTHSTSVLRAGEGGVGDGGGIDILISNIHTTHILFLPIYNKESVETDMVNQVSTLIGPKWSVVKTVKNLLIVKSLKIFKKNKRNQY